jgi:hypothetical protein
MRDVFMVTAAGGGGGAVGTRRSKKAERFTRDKRDAERKSLSQHRAGSKEIRFGNLSSREAGNN